MKSKAPFLTLATLAALALLGGVARAQLDVYPPVTAPPENPSTAMKETLGKILFWEEQLSSTNTTSCGTCHFPSAGGSDPRSVDPDSLHPGPDGLLGTGDETIGSKGVLKAMFGGEYVDDGVFFPRPQVTGRKSPSMMDAMFAPKLFWDGRATSQFIDPETGQVAIASGGALESQVVGPPLSNVEMAHDGRFWGAITWKLERVDPLRLSDPSTFPADITAALALHPTYPDLFEAAFGLPPVGEDLISAKRIGFAVAAYERTLVSNETPYDFHAAAVNAGNPGASPLPANEQNGLNVFLNQTCGICHSTALFSSQGFFAVGVTNPDDDEGLGAITGLPTDRGVFKVPTLRNVGLREAGGLFHHGTANASSLESVVNFYNTGPTFPENTMPSLMPNNLGITPQEASDIAMFLRNGLTDPRAANETGPFARPKLRSEIDAEQDPATASILALLRPDGFPPELIPYGTADSDGNVPEMVLVEPASREHSYFTIGVAGAKGGQIAYLVAGPANAVPLYASLPTIPIWIDVNDPSLLISGIILNGGMGPAEGYGSLTVDISDNPALIDFEIAVQWFVTDPILPAPGNFSSTRGYRIRVLG